MGNESSHKKPGVRSNKDKWDIERMVRSELNRAKQNSSYLGSEEYLNLLKSNVEESDNVDKKFYKSYRSVKSHSERCSSKRDLSDLEDGEILDESEFENVSDDPLDCNDMRILSETKRLHKKYKRKRKKRLKHKIESTSERYKLSDSEPTVIKNEPLVNNQYTYSRKVRKIKNKSPSDHHEKSKKLRSNENLCDRFAHHGRTDSSKQMDESISNYPARISSQGYFHRESNEISAKNNNQLQPSVVIEYGHKVPSFTNGSSIRLNGVEVENRNARFPEIKKQRRCFENIQPAQNFDAVEPVIEKWNEYEDEDSEIEILRKMALQTLKKKEKSASGMDRSSNEHSDSDSLDNKTRNFQSTDSERISNHFQDSCEEVESVSELNQQLGIVLSNSSVNQIPDKKYFADSEMGDKAGPKSVVLVNDISNYSKNSTIVRDVNIVSPPYATSGSKKENEIYFQEIRTVTINRNLTSNRVHHGDQYDGQLQDKKRTLMDNGDEILNINKMTDSFNLSENQISMSHRLSEECELDEMSKKFPKQDRASESVRKTSVRSHFSQDFIQKNLDQNQDEFGGNSDDSEDVVPNTRITTSDYLIEEMLHSAKSSSKQPLNEATFRIKESTNNNIIAGNSYQRISKNQTYKTAKKPNRQIKRFNTNVLSSVRLKYKIRISPAIRTRYRYINLALKKTKKFSKSNDIISKISQVSKSDPSTCNKNSPSKYRLLKDEVFKQFHSNKMPTNNASKNSHRLEKLQKLESHHEETTSASVVDRDRMSNFNFIHEHPYSGSSNNNIGNYYNYSNLSSNDKNSACQSFENEFRLRHTVLNQEPSIPIKSEPMCDEGANIPPTILNLIKCEKRIIINEGNTGRNNYYNDDDDDEGDDDEEMEDEEQNSSTDDEIVITDSEAKAEAANPANKTAVLKNLEGYLLPLREKLVKSVDELYGYCTDLNGEISKQAVALNKLKWLKGMMGRLESELNELDIRISRKFNAVQGHYDIINTRSGNCAKLEKMCRNVGSSVKTDYSFSESSSYEIIRLPSDNEEALFTKLTDLRAAIEAITTLRQKEK